MNQPGAGTRLSLLLLFSKALLAIKAYMLILIICCIYLLSHYLTQRLSLKKKNTSHLCDKL